MPPGTFPQVTTYADSASGRGLHDVRIHAIDFYLQRGFSTVRTTNRGQLEQTLKELRNLGRIDKIHAAVVQALRSMAFALDADPANAALWKQYREALKELTADDDAGSLDDALSDLFSEVRDETQA
jgi:hypothetical protein